MSGAAAGFAVYSGCDGICRSVYRSTPIAALSGGGRITPQWRLLAAVLARRRLGKWRAARWYFGGAVVAPLIAIAGWAYDSHAEKALNNAYQSSREVTAAVEKNECG